MVRQAGTLTYPRFGMGLVSWYKSISNRRVSARVPPDVHASKHLGNKLFQIKPACRLSAICDVFLATRCHKRLHSRHSDRSVRLKDPICSSQRAVWGAVPLERSNFLRSDGRVPHGSRSRCVNLLVRPYARTVLVAPERNIQQKTSFGNVMLSVSCLWSYVPWLTSFVALFRGSRIYYWNVKRRFRGSGQENWVPVWFQCGPLRWWFCDT